MPAWRGGYLVDDVPVVELRSGLVGDLEMTEGLGEGESALAEDGLHRQCHPCSILELSSSSLLDLIGGGTQLAAVGLGQDLQTGEPAHYFALQLEGHLNDYNLNTHPIHRPPFPPASTSI